MEKSLSESEIRNHTKRILVLCTGNSCRSQMAEGWLRNYLGSEVEIYSAGVETHGVNPYAIRVMAEVGVDISTHTSNNVEEYRGIDFDYFITICDSAQKRCPWFPPNAIHIHHPFPDPADATGTEEEITATYRRVRDMIRDYGALFARQFAEECSARDGCNGSR